MKLIRLFVNELAEGFKQSKWLPLLTAYAVLSGVIGPGIHFPLIHVPFILLGFFVAFRSKFKMEISSLLLLLYLPINIIVTQPDGVFNSWMRLELFAIVFVFASPLFKSQTIAIYRKKILLGVLTISVVLGIGSFLCYFVGINYMSNQATGEAILDFQGSAGGFGGLFVQSIIFGMVSGLGALYVFYRSSNQPTKTKKWYYVMVVVLIMATLISASRSALLASVMGMLVMLYQMNKKQGKFLRIIMGIVLLLMITYPLWDGFASGMKQKTEAGAELGAYGSRTEKWMARISEISSNPVTGIGFAAVDGHLDIIGAGGVVEPGSSWLCILSMTGIIGFFLFLMILLKPFNYLRKHPSPYNALLLGLMAFICMHMISEGYIFAGGSPLCFIAWLIFGCCNDANALKAENDNCRGRV